MQKLVTIVFLLICSQSFGRNFYVSNAGNNSNNGLTPATSWLTLAQVNATTLLSGDSILLKRGDTFYGSLNNDVSGVTYADYGTGFKPIITGFVTIAGWTNLGSNIYEAVVPNGLTSVNMVVNSSDGTTIPMGRFPNANASNGGYLTYETSSNATPSITDNQLTNSPNWTNADIVIRKRDFAITRNRVVNHATTVLTLNTGGSFAYSNGYGYFFENDIKTLDQNGEWYYDSITTKIKMYYTSTPPTIQVGTIKTLIDFPNSSGATRSNISIKNITLKGSEGDCMYISYCSNVLIDSVDFLYAGGSGLENRDMINFTLQNCKFADNHMTGIYDLNPGLNTSNNVLVKKNTFNRIGIWQGMIVRDNPNYHEGVSATAISYGCGNLNISQNIIDSVGYCGIILPSNRDGQVLHQNIISNYCFLKNDGGGIYNSGIRTGPMISVPVIIDSNIVYGSGDASLGTTASNDPHCRGIYLDASSSKVNIIGNTIYSSYEGIYLSQAQNIIVKYNTIYGAGLYAPSLNKYSGALNIFDGNAGYQHTRNNTITNNILFADTPNKLFIWQTDRYNGVDSVGIIDSNKYVNPMDDYPLFLTNTTGSSIITPFALKMWQQTYPVYDAHSTGSVVSIAPFSKVLIGSNLSPNSAFNDVNNTTAYSSPVVHTFTVDSTSQITGVKCAKLTTGPVSANSTEVFQVVGAISSTKKYVLRFKTKASKLGSFQTYLAQRSGAYAIITSKQSAAVDTVVKQYEFLFAGEHSTETTAAFYITFPQSGSTVYLDDIEFYEATSTTNVMSDYVLFSVNPTAAPLTVSLGGYSYTTLNNASINTSTTLSPFSSSILFKGAVYVAPPAPVSLTPTKLPFKFKRA